MPPDAPLHESVTPPSESIGLTEQEVGALQAVGKDSELNTV
jgi:hypothetical protein